MMLDFCRRIFLVVLKVIVIIKCCLWINLWCFRFYSNFCDLLDQHFFGFCKLFIYIHFHPPKVCTSIFGHVLLPLKNCWFSTWMVHHVLFSTICSFARKLMFEAILTLIKWKQDLKCNNFSSFKHWKNKYCKLVLYVVGRSLGEKLGFLTMVLTTFQLHFEVENVTSNYKMFFSTQNDVFNCLLK